jgi:hypothetical protein
MKPQAKHVLATILFVAASICGYLGSSQGQPVTSALHISAAVLGVASFVIAMISQSVLGGPPTNPNASRGFARLHLVAVIAIVAVGMVAARRLDDRRAPRSPCVGAGCSPSQLQQASNVLAPGIAFVACVAKVYSGEAAGTPIPQVISDELATCGGQAADVVGALDTLEPPAAHATVAHGAVR